MIGIAAATQTRSAIIWAAVAGIVAGATSMAAGEYVSVSSQSDIETADLEREKNELETMPEAESEELTDIYLKQGITPDLAKEVATQLTKHNALEVHARDELGINQITHARPLAAALASAVVFITGGMLPVIVSLFAPVKGMIYYQLWLFYFILSILRCFSCSSGRLQ